MREYVEAVVNEKDKALWNEIVSVRRAVDKAETALHERLAGMNEFRDALRDTNTLNMPRKEVDAMISSVQQRLDRKDSETDNRLKSLENSRANNEGRLWAIGAGVIIINLAITVVGFIVGK